MLSLSTRARRRRVLECVEEAKSDCPEDAADSYQSQPFFSVCGFGRAGGRRPRNKPCAHVLKRGGGGAANPARWVRLSTGGAGAQTYASPPSGGGTAGVSPSPGTACRSCLRLSFSSF